MTMELIDKEEVICKRNTNNSRPGKVHVSIDRKNYFWIIVDNGKIFKNPKKDDLIMAKEYSYNKTNICDICREEKEILDIELTDKSVLYPQNARHNVDKNGNIMDTYVCNRHWSVNYSRYSSNSGNNIKKLLRGCRTGNLDSNSNHAKGNNFEELTSRWLGAKRLSVEYNKYSRMVLDHLPILDRVIINIGNKLVDLSGKIPQTKGRFYNNVELCWNSYWKNEQGKIFDVLIFYCMNKNGNDIERIYIFPVEEIEKRPGARIVKFFQKNSKTLYWYEQYRIIDKEIIEKVNGIYKQILIEKEE